MSSSKNPNSWLVQERSLQAKVLKFSIEKEFIKSMQNLKSEDSFSDIDVYIEDEDFHLRHKCIILCLSPTLYEFLFLSENVCSLFLKTFPAHVPLLEKISLRNVYKTCEEEVTGEHEIDISSLLDSPAHSDIVFEIDGELINCHKCVLALRCQYFNIMFNGSWLEGRKDVIPINEISLNTFKQVINFIYSPEVVLHGEVNINELVFIADMYMINGLKNLLKFIVEADNCHFFHQPCDECIVQVIHTLNMSHMYNFEDLLQKCFNWFTKHYEKIFVHRDFNKCKKPTREMIVSKIKESVISSSVLQHIKCCNKVKRTLPNVNWALKTRELIGDLESFCSEFLCNRFKEVVTQASFVLVCYDEKNILWMELAQETVTSAFIKYLSVDNCLLIRAGIEHIYKYMAIWKNHKNLEGVKCCELFISSLETIFKSFVSKNYILICRKHKKELTDELKKEFASLAGYL